MSHEELQSKLSGLQSRIEALEEDLNDEAERLAEMLEGQVLPFIADANAVLGAVENAMGKVGARLADLRDRVQTGLDGFEAIRAAAVETANDSVTSAESRVETAREAVERLMGTVKQEIETAIDNLKETVVEGITSPIDQARDECVTKIGALIDEIAEKLIPDKADELTEDVCDELKEQLDELLDAFAEGIEDFRTKVFESNEKAGAARELSQQALDLLETAFAPVLGELERVRSLASLVGISI